MARSITKVEKFDVQVSDLVTGEHLLAHICIDITDECPNASESEPAELDFAHSARGLVAIIRRPNGGDGGVRADFIVTDLDKEMSAQPYNILAWTAWALGFETQKERLKKLIEKYTILALLPTT
jgi:hypothetical protein